VTIWKYPLEIADEQVVPMPIGAQLLAVQVQGERPFLWALVNPNLPKAQRFLATFGTGHHVPPNDHLTYVATYQVHQGSLVFHVFDRGYKEAR